jgi:hypothetical protein
MDKKVINEEQFKKLVISEAKKFLSEDKSEEPSTDNVKKKFSFDKVESLISEMEDMNKSISSLIDINDQPEAEDKNEGWTPKQERDLDPIEHNKKKNIMHVDEGEKDKWKRMLDYKIPKDDER